MSCFLHAEDGLQSIGKNTIFIEHLVCYIKIKCLGKIIGQKIISNTGFMFAIQIPIFSFFIAKFETFIIHITGKFDEPAGLLPLAAVFVYDNDAFNDVKDIGIFPKES